MAIVRMNRVTLVGAADIKDRLLEELMDLGVVHVEPLVELQETPAELTSRLASCRRALSELNRRAKEKKIQAGERAQLPPDQALERVSALLQKRAELESRRSALKKEVAQAQPWGELYREDIELLRENGLQLVIGLTQPGALKKMVAALDQADFWTTVPLPGGRDVGVFAIFSDRAPERLELEEVALPPRPLSQVQADIEKAQSELDAVEQQLDELAGDRTAVVRAEEQAADQLRLLEVKMTLGGDGEVFAATGWCPHDRVSEVESLAGDRALAVLVDEPEDNENPPIVLQNNKAVSFFEPLLKAYSLPHYRELDPTLFFAPFMTAFFGFCLGDVAYGILLFAAATFLGRKFKVQGEVKKAVRMIQVLGISAAVVGGLTGIAFGEKFYQMLELDAGLLLFSLSEDPAKFFYASLGFGAFQLTFGMFIQLFRLLQQGHLQEALSRIGWILILPGIGAWVVKDTPLVFAGAALLIFVFENPSPSAVRRMGGGALALYNISQLLGDVMSYARIFGLGLSTGIIGHVVNVIAAAAGSTPYIGWLFALVILVIGHTFNFAMAVIGSLVHPARLQFLEFFRYFFEGGGVAYRPFGKARGG